MLSWNPLHSNMGRWIRGVNLNLVTPPKLRYHGPAGTQTMQDLIGRTLGHYRVVDKIGEGGMGEFYPSPTTLWPWSCDTATVVLSGPDVLPPASVHSTVMV